MDALKELLKEESNLALACDIRDAILVTQIDLELCVWEKMKKEMKDLDFEDDRNNSHPLEAAVHHYYHGSRKRLWYGITCPLPDYQTLCLRVSREGEDFFYMGVSRNCPPGKEPYQAKFECEYDKVKNLLKESPLGGTGKYVEWWPFYRDTKVPDPTRSSREEYEGAVREFTQEIASGMDEIWKAL